MRALCTTFTWHTHTHTERHLSSGLEATASGLRERQSRLHHRLFSLQRASIRSVEGGMSTRVSLTAGPTPYVIVFVPVPHAQADCLTLFSLSKLSMCMGIVGVRRNPQGMQVLQSGLGRFMGTKWLGGVDGTADIIPEDHSSNPARAYLTKRVEYRWAQSSYPTPLITIMDPKNPIVSMSAAYP